MNGRFVAAHNPRYEDGYMDASVTCHLVIGCKEMASLGSHVASSEAEDRMTMCHVQRMRV